MPRYDLATVKSAAAGNWRSIVSRIGGIDDRCLTATHGPCPKCGGNDRWRVFNDFDQTGGAICNHCGKFGDGIAVVEWATGKPFSATLAAIGEFLAVTPAATARGEDSKAGGKKRGRPKKRPAGEPGGANEPDDPTLEGQFDPLAAVEILPWNPMLVQFWCLKKRLSLSSVLRANGCVVRYKRFTCVGFPVRFPENDELIGWSLYEIGGGLLPVFAKGSPEPVEWTKVKILKRREAK